MSTPHNAANKGDFAKTVLMPGDPLRAQFIAETFLHEPKLVTGVRGMLGYTGTYEGVPVSVMGSGMGMPSIGIYSWELFTQYGVENIIRVGSAGSYSPEAKVFDVVLASGAYSESSYAKTQNGFAGDVTLPSPALCNALRKSAARLGIPMIEGVIHSSDVFYRDAAPDYWQKLRDEKGCLAVEMESFALVLLSPAETVTHQGHRYAGVEIADFLLVRHPVGYRVAKHEVADRLAVEINHVVSFGAVVACGGICRGYGLGDETEGVVCVEGVDRGRFAQS